MKGNKFGIFIGGATYIGVVPEIAMLTEKMGFDSFWVSDHMFLPEYFYQSVGMDISKGEYPFLEAWTTIAAVSTITKKIKLGVGVTPIPMRQPAILAKQVATIDFISNGRVIFGVGAGWHRKEFESYGLPYDTHQVRINKMMEGLEVIKKLWTEPFASYNGKYYKIREAPLWPKPIQKPHPPIWFGGTSIKILNITSLYGQGWVPYCPTAEQFKELYSKIEEIAKKAGRNPSEIEPACVVLACISSNYDEARKIAESIIKLRGSFSLKPEEWDEAEKRGIYGGPDDCIERIEEYFKAGVKHILFEIISPKIVHNNVKLFGEKVISYFKEKSF
ncbi:MAG: LLM class flavin-dependent oxidoreductase [Nitrososphaerota archaeon]